MVDLPVWDQTYLMSAYRDIEEFQVHARQMGMALVGWLHANSLLIEPVSELGSAETDTLRIMESHLSPIGQAMSEDLAFDRWMKANDDIQKPVSMRSLDRSLKKCSGLTKKPN